MIELTHYSVGQYKKIDKLPIKLLADNVRSMHNIGSIFRTADAFRISSIILTGISGCPPHPEIGKTALGAENSVEWNYIYDSLEATLQLKEEGWKICVLEQTHNSIPLQKFNPKKEEVSSPHGEDTFKYVVVVGNEVHGVDQRIVDIADYVLEIPQEGTKHSLNVSTSAAIALFHLYLLQKQR